METMSTDAYAMLSLTLAMTARFSVAYGCSPRREFMRSWLSLNAACLRHILRETALGMLECLLRVGNRLSLRSKAEAHRNGRFYEGVCVKPPLNPDV